MAFVYALCRCLKFVYVVMCSGVWCGWYCEIHSHKTCLPLKFIRIQKCRKHTKPIEQRFTLNTDNYGCTKPGMGRKTNQYRININSFYKYVELWKKKNKQKAEKTSTIYTFTFTFSCFVKLFSVHLVLFLKYKLHEIFIHCFHSSWKNFA